MFILKNKLTVGFLMIDYKNEKKINHVHQCTKLISHSLSQILNQIDKNEIK